MGSTQQSTLKIDEPLGKQVDVVGFVVGGGESSVKGVGLLSQGGAGAQVLERLSQVPEGIETRGG